MVQETMAEAVNLFLTPVSSHCVLFIKSESLRSAQFRRREIRDHFLKREEQGHVPRAFGMGGITMLICEKFALPPVSIFPESSSGLGTNA